MQIAAGVDAGSAFTRCMILGLDGEEVRFLGCGQARSGGWFKGRVADRRRITKSILEAVKGASRQAGVEVDSVVLGVGGPPVYGFNHHWPYQFGRPREVDASDLEFAVEQAADVRFENDRMLLHVCPQDFTVDGRARFHFPRGAVCTRLEANVHLVTTSTMETQVIVSAAHEAHLAVEETVFEPLAAAYACLLQEDRSRGVAVVDIGLHSTDLVVYDGDALVHSRSLPICGDHFTKDVAWGFTIPYKDAERLKLEFGCAILGLTADNSLIVVPSPDGKLVEAPRRRLNEILEARAEELFLYVANELRYCGMEKSLVEGVVLTGGVAEMEGLCDVAERVLNCQARKGLTIGVRDYPQACDSPAWTAAAGLAMYSARLKVRRRRRRRAPGLLDLVLR